MKSNREQLRFVFSNSVVTVSVRVYERESLCACVFLFLCVLDGELIRACLGLQSTQNSSQQSSPLPSSRLGRSGLIFLVYFCFTAIQLFMSNDTCSILLCVCVIQIGVMIFNTYAHTHNRFLRTNLFFPFHTIQHNGRG